jgi:hypothetical protein
MSSRRSAPCAESGCITVVTASSSSVRPVVVLTGVEEDTMDRNPARKDSRRDDARDEDAEIVELLRLARSVHARTAGASGDVLSRLGFDAEDGVRFARLLDRLKDVRAPITGVLDPGPSPHWQPSVMAPVFYGFSDHGTADGLPGPARVFYPSLEGSPQDAPMLTGVGRYPAVLFLHGQCNESGGGPEHYLRWDLAPIQLARSGYVVIVPRLASNAPFGGHDNPDVSLALDAVRWLRSTWAHRGELMPAPMTAVVGHSWGALAGGAVAERLQAEHSISAYASLSGGWLEWPSTPARPLDLDLATMFMWGTGSSDLFANLTGGAEGIFLQPQGAKHRVIFQDGEHFDYFREGSTACGRLFRGPCALMRPLAADFLATFLSHYMPPQHWSFLSSTIPHSLVPPPRDLTPEQEFFAGGHLSGFPQIAGAAACRVTHEWRLPPFLQGSIVLGAG